MTYFSRVLVAIILFFGFSNTTFAQANISFSPSVGEFFQFTLDENETAEDYATIYNGADEAQYVIVTAVDGTLTTQGHFALESLDRSREQVGNWTKLEKSKYTIPAKSSVNVPFSLTLPANTTPGEYTGGLLLTGDNTAKNAAAVSQNEADASTTGAAISINVGTRIYLKVLGDLIMNVSWNEFSHSFDEVANRYQFNNQFTNEGNVQVKLTGDVTISSPLPFFEDITMPIEDKLVNPNEPLNLATHWDNLPKFGLFNVKSSINYQRNALFSEDDALTDVSQVPTDRSLSIWIIPIKEIMISFVISLICFFILMYRNHRFQKLLSATQSYQWPTDESLVAIATRYKTDWKLLAKLNKIKSPYMVSTGQTLRLPIIQQPVASSTETDIANTQN